MQNQFYESGPAQGRAPHRDVRHGVLGSALSLRLAGMNGSTESGVLDESVFVSATMILTWMVDPSGLERVDLGRTTRTMVLSETEPRKTGCHFFGFT